MGAQAETNAMPQVDPIKLQSNIQQTFALWQEFAQRMMQNYLNQEGGMKPADNAAFTRAAAQWAANLAKNPQPVAEANVEYLTQQTQLIQRMTAKMMGDQNATLSDQPVKDRRFRAPEWGENTMTEFMMHSYMNFANYWKTLSDVKGDMQDKEAMKAAFFINTMVDALSPNNFAATNPEVWRSIRETNGESLVNAMKNLLNDFQDGELRIRMTDTQAFELGRDIATTPGKVVFRNNLIELIQYTPSTDKVRQTPLLIVPPMINKFYILDLQEKNSLVKWAVDQGHTVFLISWRNPNSSMKDYNFENYLQEGTLAAMDAVKQATGEAELNMAAYCLGGTLASATLAYLESQNDKRVQSATFFTTLIDFSDPGEIGVFLDDEQVTALEKRMEEDGGYLDGKNMGAAFNMLRANDLIWSFFINLYLLGKDPMPFDLLYWNSDSTRLPAAFHSFYLRNMYLENRYCQAEGIKLLNQPIDVSSITTPAYFVSAKEDHIAPWKTTYKGFKLLSGPKRFVLGESGHIAGIVNPANRNKYGHYINDTVAETADEWLKGAEKVDLSWWHDWDKWVSAYAGEEVDAREPGAGELESLCDAPGTYVVEK